MNHQSCFLDCLIYTNSFNFCIYTDLDDITCYNLDFKSGRPMNILCLAFEGSLMKFYAMTITKEPGNLVEGFFWYRGG